MSAKRVVILSALLIIVLGCSSLAYGVFRRPISNAFLNQGIAARDANNWEAARKYYNIAILIDPTYSWAYVHRGYISDLSGDPASALSDYTIALNLGVDATDEAY